MKRTAVLLWALRKTRIRRQADERRACEQAAVPRHRKPERGVFKVTLCVIMFTLTLSGCWSYLDVNHVNVVAGIALDIDSETGEYVLSAEVVDLTGSIKNEGVKSIIISRKGKTVYEAVSSMRNITEKKLYFGNIKLLALSKSVSEEKSIEDILDWFIREQSLRETLFITVADCEKASDLLSLKPPEGGVMSYKLRNMLFYGSHAVTAISPVDVFGALDKLGTPGTELTLPVFAIEGEGDERLAVLKGIAVYRGSKVCGYIDMPLAGALIFLNSENDNGRYVLNIPEVGNLSVKVYSNRAKRNYSSGSDGRITITLDIRVRAEIEESMLDLNDEDMVNNIERTVEKMIEDHVESLVSTAQNEYGADVFGFGETIYNRDSKLWQSLDWQEEFPRVDTMVKVSAKVVRPS